MIYLLDASVLITANRQYYAIDRVPEFWEWLVYMGTMGNVKIPKEIYEEFKDGKDALSIWAKEDEVESALLLDEDVDIGMVRRVMAQGYAPDLTDDEIEKLGRDPFLIAHALTHAGNRSVATTEVSKPKKVRANRHVPNVCDDFGVPCLNTFQLTTALDFRTDWKKK
jgi:Domain of unknown function (DUF4411)